MLFRQILGLCSCGVFCCNVVFAQTPTIPPEHRHQISGPTLTGVPVGINPNYLPRHQPQAQARDGGGTSPNVASAPRNFPTATQKEEFRRRIAQVPPEPKVERNH